MLTDDWAGGHLVPSGLLPDHVLDSQSAVHMIADPALDGVLQEHGGDGALEALLIVKLSSTTTKQ